MLAPPSESAAAADEGEATTFRLPNPVFLPAAHTASVPILDHDVAAERLDLLQGDRPHPLAAVRLLNETGEALPAGVLTLYAPGEAARFAGDARLGGLPAGETRLLSFAEDLRTTAERHVEQSLRVGSVTAAGGVLKIEERDRQALKIRLTAPAMEKQTVLVEIPKEQDRTITIEAGQPPVTEETATAWRIAVALKPGETRCVSAWLDRTLRNDMVLASTDPASLVALTREDGMSASAHAALQHLVALQQAVTDRSDRLRQFDAGIAAIGPDQQRIRQNLASVSNGDALHGRLLRELEADEDKLAGIQHDREQAETALDAARRDLAQAIETLSL